MSKRAVIAVIIAIIVIAIAIGIVQYLRGMGGDAQTYPGASNTSGPAEGGALETGAALDSSDSYHHLPARNMPHTIASYPPGSPPSPGPSQASPRPAE